MLPTAARLTTADQFSAVMRSGYRVGTRHVAIHLRKSGAVGPARAGFVVSTKVGNSVIRHRVARRLRHQIRPLLAQLPAGTDVVVRAFPLAGTAASAELLRDLGSGISRAASKVYGTGFRIDTSFTIGTSAGAGDSMPEGGRASVSRTSGNPGEELQVTATSSGGA